MYWAEITQRQAGIVARPQLQNAGLRPNDIGNLLRTKRLNRTGWPRIYRAAGSPLTPESTIWAAVLGCDGVLSHLSAARWWGYEVPSDNFIHVITRSRRQREIPTNIRVHRLILPGSSVASHHGMPITTRTETLLDCVSSLPARQAIKLFDRSMQLGWLTSEIGHTRLARQPHRHGNLQLRKLLVSAASGTHSEAERLMVQILRHSRITGWRANIKVVAGGTRCIPDIAFVGVRLAIEVDGWAFHSDPERFISDRHRQNALVSSGWTVLRFTWWDLTQQPEAVTAQIRRALARLTTVVSV